MKINALILLASAASVLAAPVADAKPAEVVAARDDYGSYGKYGTYENYPPPPTSYTTYGTYRRAVDWVKGVFA
ncbi:hypothetical protein PG985_001361 [Apiospora marii]|uniref:Uncharacterized protein n=1 Tax=Apiospora marii TaxID=335849 RepID=A0ABR1RI56_9PEZI